MLPFIILGLILIFLIRAWYRDHYRYWTKRGFPTDESNFPFDSITGVGTKVHNAEKFEEYYQRFKGEPVVGLFLMFTPALTVHDPALIQSILVKDFASFHDHFIYFNEVSDPLSAHLVAIEGQKWRERRTTLAPTFSSGKMKIMFDLITTIGDKLVASLGKSLGDSDEHEVYEWFRRYTTDVIANLSFGLDSNCLENPKSEFRKYGNKLFSTEKPSTAIRWIFVNSFPRFSRFLGLMINDKSAADFFMKVFKDTVDHREKSNIARTDYVQLTLQLKQKGKLTINEMAAESLISYVAGYHTAGSVMTFVLYELALNRDIQERLRQEIIDSLAENNGTFTYDSVSQMKYLEMVVSETMRMYPPANLLTRKCTKDYPIPGSKLVIPRGTQILINAYSLHRNPEYFPDPSTFDPERFNEMNIKNIRPFTYLPFGELSKESQKLF